ncbi:MAG: flagellar basal body rod protein FlgB [Deltaproteobacteria bacterium]|nr:flagellar basal body rod protein FlgB [Deltaproteobacteria bacterium]
MSLDVFFGTTINLLGKTLDLRAQNHNRISANLANIETPGYTPTTLSFEQELKSALRDKGGGSSNFTSSSGISLRGEPTALELVNGTVLETPSGTPGRDGNSVELETEMGKMMENQIMYNASVQLLSRKFEGLKLAIKGG